MTVKIPEMSRDKAEALFDAAVYTLTSDSIGDFALRPHLFDAAIEIALACGMRNTVKECDALINERMSSLRMRM